MGNLPFDDSIFAPILANGSITLLIGREDKDSSPQNERFNPMPAVKPNIRRKPVPELPKLSDSSQC